MLITHRLLIASAFISTVSAFGAGCVAQAAEPVGGSAEALLASGQDAADKSCNVVLEGANLREVGVRGNYEQDCSTGTCYLVWYGSVRLSAEAIAEGGVPAVLYASTVDGFATWHEAPATSPDGSNRYEFALRVGTLRRSDDYNQARMDIIPFVRFPGGGRLFDHNRYEGSYDNYEISWKTGWRYFNSPSVCPEGAAP